MGISLKNILPIFLALQVAVVVLFNQRQYYAVLLFIPTILLAVTLLAPSSEQNRRTLFSAPCICGFIVLVAFVSNLSYLTPEIYSPVRHWLRLLYPITLLAITTRIFQKNPDEIRWFIIIFLLVLLVAIFKTFDSSKLIELSQGVKRQSNWGNAVAGCSPFIFLLRRNLLKNVLLFVTIVALIVSLKRTGMLAVIALVIAYIAPMLSFSQVGRLVRPKVFVSLLGSLFLFLIGTFFALRNSVFLDYISRAQLRIYASEVDIGSGRLNIWLEGIKIYEEGNPFQILFGRGYCWFHDNAHLTVVGAESLHNDAVEFLVSFGVFGLVLYLLLFGRIVSHGLFFLKSRYDASFALAVVLVFSIYTLFAGMFFYLFFFPPLFIAIGYLEARRSIVQFNQANIMRCGR